MTDLPPAQAVRRPPLPRMGSGCVTLAHHERLLRRRRLVTVHGEGFLVDLPRTAAVAHGDAFELADGRLIDVVAADEPLIEVRLAPGDERLSWEVGAAEAPRLPPSLARLAWHLGNRHCPCQVEPDRLLIPHDPVLRAMLLRLGAAVADTSEPFAPEGGAYGEGHPMGHGHSSGGDGLGLGALADG